MRIDNTGRRPPSYGLRFHTARSGARSADEHLPVVKAFVDEFEPACVVIDPISAMVKARGHHAALSVVQRLII